MGGGGGGGLGGQAPPFEDPKTSKRGENVAACAQMRRVLPRLPLFKILGYSCSSAPVGNNSLTVQISQKAHYVASL